MRIVNSILILLVVLMHAAGCENNELIPEEDGTVPEKTLAQSVEFCCAFEADVEIGGQSFKTDPRETTLITDSVAPVPNPTYLYCKFIFSDESGNPITIEATPVDLSGEKEHVFFDCDVTMTLSINDTKQVFQAREAGFINVNSGMSAAKVREMGGYYTGEILLTWNDGETTNSFHLTHFYSLAELE